VATRPKKDVPLPGVEVLADGRCRALVYLGRDAGGQRRYTRRTFPDVKAANAWKVATLRERDAGTRVDDAGMTVRSLCLKWLELPGVRRGASTRQTYRVALERHVLPGLGGTRLDRLTTWGLQTHFDALVDAGRGVPSLTQAHKALSGALKQAVAWGLLEKNPCRGVVLPPHDPDNPAAAVPLADARALLAACLDDEEHGALFALLLFTGLRIGEAAALGWGAVDLEAGVLRVVRHLTHRGSGWVMIAGAKSKAGQRPIKLSAEAVAVLKRQRANQNAWRLALGADWAAGDLVFTDRTGCLLSRSMPGRALERLCARAGIARLTPHDLRASHATFAAEAAERSDLLALRQRLGHADLSTTLGYVQQGTEGQAEMVARLDELLREARSGG
jgi:integrase